jgi:phospholipid/cholesterol/gamma-HCH transport system substrate-binding protein
MSRLGAARHPILGVIALLVALGLITTAVAAFSGALTPKVEISVDTDRIGLLMETENRVLVDGVVVGYVDGITPRGDGARLTLALTPSLTKSIPSDVVPTVDATTVFGPKTVSLHRLPGDRKSPITAGAVLSTSTQATEVNDVFEQLTRILDAVDPAELSSVLGETANALRGRGAQTGELISQLDDLLVRFNPSLPTLRTDLQRAAPVLNTYADVTPDLVRTLDNLKVTSNTVVDKQAQLGAFLLDLTRFGNDTRTFLATNERALGLTLDVLAPTTRLLARYAPMFPCFFEGLDHNRRLLEQTVGGNGKSAGFNLSISPGTDPYRTPRDLPVVGADSGPSCANLPITTVPPPYYPSNTGTNPKAGRPGPTLNQPLAVYLFGDQSPFSAQGSG